MSKESTLFTIGVLVLVSPYLGLPMSWLSIVLTVCGVFILSIAYLIRKEHVKKTEVQMTHLEPPAPPPPAPAPYDAPSSIA